jgi:hypothetical protein
MCEGKRRKNDRGKNQLFMQMQDKVKNITQERDVRCSHDDDYVDYFLLRCGACSHVQSV